MNLKKSMELYISKTNCLSLKFFSVDINHFDVACHIAKKNGKVTARFISKVMSSLEIYSLLSDNIFKFRFNVMFLLLSIK